MTGGVKCNASFRAALDGDDDNGDPASGNEPCRNGNDTKSASGTLTTSMAGRPIAVELCDDDEDLDAVAVAMQRKDECLHGSSGRKKAACSPLSRRAARRTRPRLSPLATPSSTSSPSSGTETESVSTKASLPHSRHHRLTR
ncbi:unnamed protein product [Notodromas monacha]|uniref:Uncharacterized protein n=1 Tax=Notodromas monacha TaxID=399045 RepID=A0A7R9BR47_9CRUS|nr:unnamed protein product [Notodromas monacha]CAG0920162.1 unnamed protein product [Notodromas monacha]